MNSTDVPGGIWIVILFAVIVIGYIGLTNSDLIF